MVKLYAKLDALTNLEEMKVAETFFNTMHL